MSGDLWAAYDEMGDDYRAHAEHSSANAHYDRPAVLDLLGPVTGLRVLDAACGPGIYSEELLARGAEVTAFDASQTMVDLALRRVGSRARVERAVLGERLPYESDVFDAIVCALAIHYVTDLRAAFDEFYRVLRPGGSAVVSTTHPTADWLRKGGSYFERVLETDEWRLASGDQPVQFWRGSLTSLCTAATDAGFVIGALSEPLPAQSMRERDPHEYERLTREPGFLILRLLALAG